MFVVAIAELKGAVEAEATALAADLGCTAYDARLLLAPGVPAIVRTLPERDAALALLGKLRARGHGALACDTASVVASSSMVSMRRFRLRSDAITLDDAADAHLPLSDVVAMVAATHRRRTDTETISRDKRFSVGRALMTSGLSMTKTVTTASRSANEERESVLYLFRSSGAVPWILRERGTSWAGHGEQLATSEMENFRVAVTALRSRVSGAAYDDRLVSRRAPERAALSGSIGTTNVTTSSDAGVDLLAHVLAAWLAKSAAYR